KLPLSNASAQMKSASSSLKFSGRTTTPIPTRPSTNSRKNTTAVSPTPTNTSPPAFPAGKRIAATFTSCGVLLTKSIHIPPAAPTTAPCGKAAARPRRTTGSSGAIAISKVSATTSNSNSSIPPPVHFKDLNTEVFSHIIRNQMDISYDVAFLRATTDSVIVPITLQIPNGQMGYRAQDGVHSAIVNVYMRISSPGGRVIQTSEE